MKKYIGVPHIKIQGIVLVSDSNPHLINFYQSILNQNLKNLKNNFS